MISESLQEMGVRPAYDNIYQLFLGLAEQLRPPERISVSKAAAKYRYINQPGAYVGPWKNETTPYMVEPMDMMASRKHSKIAFIGPAQSGKTDSLIINGLVYSTRVDPMDTLLFCPTQSAARDFSMRRVDRLFRHSPEVGKMLLPGKDADNVFDKHLRTGMILTLAWPSVTELAGRPVGRVLLTDYDRMDDDIGGDGNAFDLASKRTTTFGSYAMCLAESSPSREILDPNWIPHGEHEAPPCQGIVALYNRGDRRRWQWPCPHCWTWFEGTFDLLSWHSEPGMSNLEKAETAVMVCPHCGAAISQADRPEMQLWGHWVAEGQRVNEKGQRVGEPRKSDFVSYWLRGTAATFTNWTKLVNAKLDAEDEFMRTMSEESLKKFWNNDMGEPYRTKAQDSARVPETLMARAFPQEEPAVIDGVRFLVGVVDVQKHRFVVQVFGVMPGTPFDTVLVDRFDITKSKRVDADGDPEGVLPATYLDDWHLIEEKVMERTYPLADGSGRHMKVKITGCDSGGKDGVTNNAYDFYRYLRAKNAHGRFVLLKGTGSPYAPRTQLALPDSQHKSNKSAARGDIPVLILNSNMLKDSLSGRLDCVEPGKGMYHIPAWVPEIYYKELCAEVREPKGWVNPSNTRNEAWDLSYYLLGVCICPKVLNVEVWDWEKPPIWAEKWDKNPLIYWPSAPVEETNEEAADKVAAVANILA